MKKENSKWGRIVHKQCKRIKGKSQPNIAPTIYQYHLNSVQAGVNDMPELVWEITKKERQIKEDHQMTLWLSKNKFGAEGCLALGNGLWKHLVKLNLEWNKIGAKGCSYLVKSRWHALKELHLFGNYLGKQGCIHLSKNQWQALQELDLEQNYVHDDGCAYFVKARLPKLKKLYLSGNDISSLGCKELLKGFWPQLQQIYFGNSLMENNNMIGKEGYHCLKRRRWEISCLEIFMK